MVFKVVVNILHCPSFSGLIYSSMARSLTLVQRYLWVGYQTWLAVKILLQNILAYFSIASVIKKIIVTLGIMSPDSVYYFLV
jgi:hypothetical protein